MSADPDKSRRLFLQSSGALTSLSLLRIGAPALMAITQAACSAKQEAAAFITLGAAEAADFAAIAARIMPTTDTPGASEAGVIYFFDRALGAEMQSSLENLRTGLAALNANTRRFAEDDEDTQDQRLTEIEDSPFFDSMWSLTMFGFFSMSKHGGNKDQVAWDLIGFKGNHGAWEYPFGYYDAEYAKEHSNDE
jgi:gluconate 2-dehydrogenase gamma chain